MGKLKLQMHVSLDGFVNAKSNWDDEVRAFSIANLGSVDRIVLGSNTAMSLIPYWAGVATNPNDPDHDLGKRITEIPKIIFSNTLTKPEWPNVGIAAGDLAEGIKQLKKGGGKDMMVYGGSRFASSLIKEGLVDQYYFLVGPIAIGKGQPIFQDLKKDLSLSLVESRQFPCGIVLHVYEPK